MLNIKITHKAKYKRDYIKILNDIAEQIKDGMTDGEGWSINGKE